jgi:transcriptional regulator with XRE-family HTH domain
MPRQTSRANQADHHVAQRIRARRIMLGLTQDQLAQELSITYQQMHKYERGVNRVSASRLYEIAEVLRVPPEYFFVGIEAPARAPNARERLTLEVVRNVAAITDPHLQEMLGNLARSLAGPDAVQGSDEATGPAAPQRRA